MHYIPEENRQQGSLFPELLDDYVQANNPVRFLDRFVETLDLAALGFSRATLKATGRPPYAPSVLLKLYLYGYLYQHRSTRQLERQTHCNVEVMWLVGRLQPDFKTLADFRRDNGMAIQAVVKSFRRLCRSLDLYGRELVAIDGSFFKASNSRARYRSQQSLDADVKRLDRQIAAHLAAMDQADQQESGASLTDAELAEKLARLDALQVRRSEQQAQQARLAASGETQECLTDRDARLLKKGGKPGVIGYNVQLAVDSRHHLIAVHDVTNASNDLQQLAPMVTASQAALETEELTVVADAGYYSRAGLKASADHGVTAYVATHNSSISKARGRYSKADFAYDAARDTYRCPARQTLSFVGTGRDRRGQVLRYYRARGCATCPLRESCLKPGTAYRRLSRWEHEAVMDANTARLQARPQIMRQRIGLAEHPFGTLKLGWGYQHFLTRGLARVRTEMSLAVLAYNLKRALKVLGVERLLQGLEALPSGS